MSKKKKRLKRKILLPTDRNGVPIEVGDMVACEDGTVMKVVIMHFFGEDSDVGDWLIEGWDDDEYSGNPRSCVVISKRETGKSLQKGGKRGKH